MAALGWLLNLDFAGGEAAAVAGDLFPGDTDWSASTLGDTDWTRSGPGDSGWTRDGPGDANWSRRES